MKKIDIGIYENATTRRAFQRVAPGSQGLRSKRFPRDTAIKTIKLWQAEQRVSASKQPPARAHAGTLAAAAGEYLRQVAAMPTIRDRRHAIAAWVDVYGDMSRDAITTGMIRAQLQTWRAVGPVVRYICTTGERRLVDQPLSAASCNHRRTALLHLYTVLDGKSARNPVRDVPQFREPQPKPRAFDLAFLDAARQRITHVEDRARVGVLLWTGARGTSELGRMTAQHVDLDARVCHIPTAKNGTPRLVTLNAHGVAAWREFAHVGAWGHYPANRLRMAFQRACRNEARARGLTMPALTPYDLRHSIATATLAAGADVADVQSMLGHTTPRMTRRYAPFQRAKLAAATDRLEAVLTAPQTAPAAVRATKSYPVTVQHGRRSRVRRGTASPAGR